MTDMDLDIPEFLRLTAEQRYKAWEHHPPRCLPASYGRTFSETERAYRASILRDKALKAALAEPAKQAFFAKKAAEAKEIKAVKTEARKIHSRRRRARSY